VRPVYCGFNYGDLASNGKLCDIMMGIYEFRRVLDALFEYDKGEAREAISEKM
jgi:hypothetical protein